MTRRISRIAPLLGVLAVGCIPSEQPQAADCEGAHWLRAGGDSQEWSDSPEDAPRSLHCYVDAGSIAGPASLLIEHDGVKRNDWRLSLNGEPLGSLEPDEHRLLSVFAIPEATLQPGRNEVLLEVEKPDVERHDDIHVERVRIVPSTPDRWRNVGRVEVRVLDQSGVPIPARITITDDAGALVPLGAESGEGLAVRTGVAYTASGEATFGVPAGELNIQASRGFEYSVAGRALAIAEGAIERIDFTLEHQVDIPGWTSGDTHLHTLEVSGHGDASVAERAITVVGEGLDWAVSTEHNLPLEFPALRDDVTVIRGVEVTTMHGHFNVFPWPEDVPFIDLPAPWRGIFAGMPEQAVAIWNHPRDVHGGYRPFDPSHYLASAATSLDGRVFPGAAMEVVNSSAMYSHPFELIRDWMRHLNRGARIAAVGSSDSHTVSIVHVGQARTYAQTGEGTLSPDAVARAFREGKTAVSYGLLAFLDEQGKQLRARVYGPSWNPATRVLLFANGELIDERPIQASAGGGLQWEAALLAPALTHDAHLALVAVGEGDYRPYWPLNRPYQAVTPEWEALTLGVSPALRWDGDNDGRFETARDIAERLIRDASDDASLVAALESHDRGVAAQAAVLLADDGRLAAVVEALSESSLNDLFQEAAATLKSE